MDSLDETQSQKSASNSTKWTFKQLPPIAEAVSEHPISLGWFVAVADLP